MSGGLVVPGMTFVAPLWFNELQFQIVNGYKFSHDEIGTCDFVAFMLHRYLRWL